MGAEKSTEHYEARLAAEKSFFTGCETVHDLPAIFHYWAQTYVRPKLDAAGFGGGREVFSDALLDRCERGAGRLARFLSIGSGNCDTEVELAVTLREAGHTDFVIDCLDLNESMLERGRVQAAGRGVSGQVNPIAGDFNEWRPDGEYDAVIAIEALHHVLDLEGMFSAITERLRPGGVFVIHDTIGRNGHRRWPEAMAIVHEFWRRLPPSYRFNQLLRRYEELYQDWDCSQSGFEGIRAQDILPLLIERFSFQRFVAYGNVIDPFVDRGFGHNFNAAAEWDRAFIDEIHRRDEAEIAAGRITPTHMLAVVGASETGETLRPGSMNPSSCVRRTDVAHVQSEKSVAPAYAWPGSPHDLQREVEVVAGALVEAQSQLQETTGWAVGLAQEVERVKAVYATLHQDFEERSVWAVDLAQEVERVKAMYATLHQAFEERSVWALSLEKELRAARAALEELASRNIWWRLRNVLRSGSLKRAEKGDSP